MSGSNFNHTVITSDGAALIRRSREENKKIVFVKAVSSQKFESLRGDLVHKPISWFESIEGSISAVQAVDGVFKMACQFSQAPSTVTLKSIGIIAKLANETDDQAILFSAASDDNSQLIVDESNAVVAFVQDLPASINSHNTDSYGTIPQGGGGGGGGDLSNYVTKSELATNLESYVASGEYDSVNHNILLKNADGETLSTIDATDFIKDGMIDNVEIVNNNLVITFNTDSGKETITISLSSIFDPTNYYTKSECNSLFLTSSDLSTYALKSEIPTDTSDLNNDSGFITLSDLSTYALKSEIPTDTSDLNNDSGFITSSALSDYALKSEVPTDTSDLTNGAGFITSSALSGYALSSEIPTDNSELTNGAGYITLSNISNMVTTDTAQTITAAKSYTVNNISFPFASQPLKLELVNNNTDALFTKGDGSTVTIALSGGGSGSYVTTNTAQTITGAKVFENNALKLANPSSPSNNYFSFGISGDNTNSSFAGGWSFDDLLNYCSSGFTFNSARTGKNKNLSISVTEFDPSTYDERGEVGIGQQIIEHYNTYCTDCYLTSSTIGTMEGPLVDEAEAAGQTVVRNWQERIRITRKTNTVDSSNTKSIIDLYADNENHVFTSVSFKTLANNTATEIFKINATDGVYSTRFKGGYEIGNTQYSFGVAGSKGVDTTIGASPSNDLPTSLAVTTWVGNQGFLTSSDLSTYALKSEIPTDNSELTNGAGYLTSSDLSTYALKSEIPTDNSELTNGAGYITISDLSGYAQTADLGGAAYKGVDTSIGGSPTDNNVPTSLAVKTWVDNQGFLTSHQSLAGCVASGEYDSTNHNILLKNSSGTVLSTIDATAFIKDGMVDTVTISNNNLVITFNTDAGKQPISISLASIFDPSNYYTKSQVDSGFVTTSTNQLALTGNKAWLHDSSTQEATIEEKAYVTGGATPSMGVEKSVTSTTYVDDPTLIQEAKLELGTMSVQSSSYTYEEYPVDEEDPESDPGYFESSHDVKSVTIDANWRKIEVFHEHQDSTYDEEEQTVHDYTTSGKTTVNAGNITTNSHNDGYDLSTSFSGAGIQINRIGDPEDTSEDYDIFLSDAGLDIQLEQDSDKYVRVSVADGLEVKNGSSHVYTRVNDLGIQRGGTLYMWASIPLHFAPNYNALSVTTYGSSASTQYVPKHFITQVHFKDNGNGLSCAYQQNSFSGSGQWSPYTTCEDAVITVIDSTLKLVFGGEDIESIRITMPATHGGVCNFKILIPKNWSYVTIQGTIYADASSSADYVLSTPLTLNPNDLIIIDAQFTPTFFIPVPNNA